MKRLAFVLLLSGAALSHGVSQAWAQPTPEVPANAPELQTPTDSLDPVTVYSEAERQADESISRRTVRSVLAPVDAFNQYSRWKQPVCFNVYGLSSIAKYVVERRMKDIAAMVGAPLDRQDPCVPNVTIVFTPDPPATLQSIATTRNYLVPWAGMIRSRIKEALPIQAWYATIIKGADRRKYLQYDGYNDDEPYVVAASLDRFNSGVETELGAVTILVDTNAIMGMQLGTLADHFALISLSQSRVSRGCLDVDSIANLPHKDCPPNVTVQAITLGDVALLTGLYKTSDDRLQNLHAQRIIGSMREVLEAQLTSGQRPFNLDFEK
jgi:hypothetical protein